MLRVTCWRLVVTVCVALGWLGVVSRAAEGLPADQQSTATLVLAGHRDSREALRSGIYRATGRRHYLSKRHGFDTDVEVSLFSAFDEEQGRVRFDRTEPPFNPRMTAGSMGGKFIRTTDRVIQSRDNGDIIDVQPVDTKPLGGIYPFDVRCLGSLNLRELEHGTSFEDAFGADGFLSSDKLSEAVKESGQIYRISWSLADGRAMRRIWFDAASGYSPIRLEDIMDTGRKRNSPMHVIEVTWVKISGIWVPSATQIEERLPMPSNPSETSEIRNYSLAFTWESVNSPVAEEFFTEKGLEDMPSQAFVVDRRLGGEPILVSKPGETDVEPVVPPERWSKGRLSTIICVTLTLAMLVFLCARSIASARKGTAD